MATDIVVRTLALGNAIVALETFQTSTAKLIKEYDDKLRAEAQRAVDRAIAELRKLVPEEYVARLLGGVDPLLIEEEIVEYFDQQVTT